jgi:hypothetical protein
VIEFAQLAQAVPAGPDVYGEFTRLGIAGAFIVILIWAVARLYNDKEKLNAARHEDARASAEMVRASTEAMVRFTASQEDRNQAIEKMATALNAMAVALNTPTARRQR